jgi:large-conductance mechanosensitive channel
MVEILTVIQKVIIFVWFAGCVFVSNKEIDDMQKEKEQMSYE